MKSTNSTNETEKSAETGQYLEIQPAEIIRGFAKFWWLCIILTVLGAGLMLVKSHVSFTPVYKSSVTFTVRTQDVGSTGLGITSYSFSYNRATASQLSSTFPNIIKSNILQDVICSDLDLTYFPCTLTASSVGGSNMFTITASGSDAQLTYDVLLSVIKNYPSVAEYVIGNTDLYILNEPELPTEPSNRLEYRDQVLKGALFGFILAAVWVFIYSVMRQTVRSRRDIRQKLNQHCLGTLPEVFFKKYNKNINHSLIITNPLVGDGYLESFRALRNTIHNSIGDSKVIMITSAAPGEGKTSASVNLALSLAMMDKSVIIVDADLRNPSVAEKLGISTAWENENSHIAKISKVQLEGNVSLSVMQFNTEKFKIWRILKHEFFVPTIDQLREKYDYVIIDTSPLGITSEPAIVARSADCALLVIKQDTIRVSRIASVIDNLLSTDITLLGCILNGIPGGMVGYGSRYGYGKYGYGYRYGYGERKRGVKTDADV